MADAHVTISERGEDRVARGHPWIYRSDVVSARAVAGDIVDVTGPRGRPVGTAFWSDRSQIALRMLTGPGQASGPDLVRQRIDTAVRFREALAIDATAYRLVHAEGDLLPSLVVDRYGDYLVVQTLSQATDRRLAAIAQDLVERLRPKGILARNDPRVRQLEGLESRVEVVHGDVPDTVTVRDGRIEYEADLWRGQKTGLFLDQRENRVAARQYARGRVLDCFSYHGGFALALASGCESVVALDSSAEAVAHIRSNAARNGLGQVEAREANVFDELRRLERAGERFDTIVLDPPAFAKNRAAVDRALAGYKEINLRALRLLTPGGVLVTCSCSYNVDEATFGAMLAEAAADARVHASVVEKRLQARDHPVLLTVPETYYLKCVMLRRLE